MHGVTSMTSVLLKIFSVMWETGRKLATNSSRVNVCR